MQSETRFRTIFRCIAIAMLPFVYLASFPPLLIMSKSWTTPSPILEAVYGPAEFVYQTTDLNWYLRLWLPRPK